LVGCLGSEPRLAESQKRHFAGALVKPPRLGMGECGPCPDLASYTLAFALQLRKITENLSQGNLPVLRRDLLPFYCTSQVEDYDSPENLVPPPNYITS
jgi:hypothetical protein